MTKPELFQMLQEKFQNVLTEHQIQNDLVHITCRALSPEEAIGETERKDFPILTGRDVMIQAEYKGHKGQAFTDAPSLYEGSLSDITTMDVQNDPHARSIFIATINAVMSYLGLCDGTVHCRMTAPELCAKKVLAYLEQQYPNVKRIAQIGYQPAILDNLAHSKFEVRVLDLNPDNVGQIRYGVLVEDGVTAMEEVIHDYAELILCTGSTLCNGTIVDYLGLDTEVLFYGTTISGCVDFLGVKRLCFAEEYKE